MNRILPACCLLFVLGALPAFAILDTNSNGLSDLWERAYNGGELFPVDVYPYRPGDDPDGDGWTNEQEAAAGTNPFVANAPDGFVRPLITHVPEVPGVSPEAITISWPTIVGKQYTLMVSSDLVEWFQVDAETLISNGDPIEYDIALPDNEKLFWRVKIEDIDSDGDELTDAEEYKLVTDPHNAQTIVGIPDLWLARYFTNVLLAGGLNTIDPNAIPNSDGYTIAQKAFLKLDPNTTNTPATGPIGQETIVNGDFFNPPIGSGNRTGISNPTWNYWGAGGVTGWSAVVGTNIEFQRIWSKDTGNQYCELKADPKGHYGIKQEVGTHDGTTYLLMLDCRDRPDFSASHSNFNVVTGDEIKKTICKISFTDSTGSDPLTKYIAPGAWTPVAVPFTAIHPITWISLVPDIPGSCLDDKTGCLVDNVKLVTVEMESKDRFFTGAFDTSIDLLQSAQVEFTNPTSGENLGSYNLDGSGDTYIYQNHDEIFSEQELDGVVGGSVGSGSNRLNQQVVFWKDGSKVRFATTFEDIGSVEVNLKKSDGTSLCKITHTLTTDSNFSELIDHLADRIDSIDGPEIDAYEIMPEIDGDSDYDDDGQPPALAAAALAASASPDESTTGWAATTRHLLSKVLIPVRAAVDGINNGAEATYKVSGGFVKGFVDGVCDGVKSDVTGIAELANMGLESLTGDFHRAKAMYDGIKTLATMTSEERGNVFDAMLVKFVDKSTTSVPWDASQMNQQDDWGISAYIAGYGGGFITEQVLAVMAQAGIVAKAGEGVKVALGGTKLGQLTVAMCQGVRQFISASFLSISIHVKVYGEKAVRSVRVMVQEVGQSFRNGKTLGEYFYEMMDRVTPAKLTFQAIADEKAVIYKTADDWLKIGATGSTIECALAADLGANLTEHGMKGFLNLWKGALRDGATGHYMHHLKNVCTVNGILDAQGLAKILEMFDSTSQSAFKFTQDAQDLAKWTSPGGVIYEAGSLEGHRIMHILTHTVPGYKPGAHSVFSVARDQVFTLIDQAWTLKGNPIQGANGRWVYHVDMSHLPDIGTNGQKFLRIVVEPAANQPSSRIVASFPD